MSILRSKNLLAILELPTTNLTNFVKPFSSVVVDSRSTSFFAHFMSPAKCCMSEDDVSQIKEKLANRSQQVYQHKKLPAPTPMF